MWNAALEAHAERMRRESAEAAKQLRIQQRRSQRRTTPPEVTRAFTEFRENRVRLAKRSGVYYPAACPHCGHTAILRAGWAHGNQRYRCHACRRTFGDGVVHIPNELMCHRCGSFDCRSGGPGKKGGRKAFCCVCSRYFIQGGSEELDRHVLILRARVALLKLPASVAEELMQQATLDVLEGHGYCWTVKLNKAAAWASEKGSWMGSGSASFLKAVGERARSDF